VPDSRLPITLLVLGAGGHGRVVADAALAQKRWAQVRISDRDAARVGEEVLPGLRVEPLGEAVAASTQVHVAIGSAASRRRECEAVGLPLASIVHPHASVSAHAVLGEGCFVGAGAVVAPGARLGTSVIVNHAAVVDHDVHVGEFSHVAPGVTLGGNVRVGARVLVGAGANVLPGVRIADDVVVGAGAVVRGDLDAPGTYAGVPARRVR
jgi:sugar O-acyltransferase (sialic acid O-acetyltransferase NeuD family)